MGPREVLLLVTLLFQQEPISACWEEATAIVLANHAETGYSKIAKFMPLRDWYSKMEKDGAARLFTMRHDQALTGYMVMMLYRDPDYEFELAAIQRTLYVQPAHRGIPVLRFVRYADRELKALGVHHITRHERTGGPRWSRLLEAEGYEEIERVLMKKV